METSKTEYRISLLGVALLIVGLIGFFAWAVFGQTPVPPDAPSFVVSTVTTVSTATVPAPSEAPAATMTHGQAAEIQVAVDKAQEARTFWTKLTNFTGAHPWLWWVFGLAVLTDTGLRTVWPSRKSRPVAVAVILSIVAIPALNLWVVVRVVVEGTAAKFGYNLHLALPSADECPAAVCPLRATGSGVLPDPNALPKAGG